MNDITDVLIQLVSTLVEKGFELPIYIFVVSINDNLVVARFEGNPPIEKQRSTSSWRILKTQIGSCRSTAFLWIEEVNQRR